MSRGAAAHRGHVVDEDGPDEVALALVGLLQRGALGLCVLDQALDEVRAALADDRRDGRVVLGRHTVPAPQSAPTPSPSVVCMQESCQPQGYSIQVRYCS